MPLDLASISSVESFGKRYASYSDRLDILVNNAGVMALPEREITKDGFEMHFGTNHIGKRPYHQLPQGFVLRRFVGCLGRRGKEVGTSPVS